MCHEAQRGVVILSLTSALDGGGWLTPHPSRLAAGSDAVLIA